MSVTYFVLPAHQTDWRMDFDSFERALREQWPEAVVKRPMARTDNPWNGGVEWTLGLRVNANTRTVGARWLDAKLSRDGQATSFKGHPALVAEYAIWLRRWQPNAPLVVVSDSDGRLLELTMDMTAGEIEWHLAGR